MNAVLVVAGGVGSRMGLDIPKQYYEVDGHPIISYGLRTFEQTECVEAVYVVCSEPWMAYIHSLIQRYRLNKVKRIVQAGNTRSESMYNGILAMAEDMVDEDFICTIDANRPLVDAQCIKRGFDAAFKYGAAVACDDCVDTMYQTNGDGNIFGVVDRSTLFKGQAPEVAKLSLAIEVLNKAKSENLPDQPLPALLLHYGKTVALTKGARKNFKITTAEDLDLFKAYLHMSKQEKQ